jgi:undecaprenyl-diphosphatase
MGRAFGANRTASIVDRTAFDAGTKGARMDQSVVRWFNEFADHTSWAHGIVAFYANAGIAVFAMLLAASAYDARRNDRLIRLAGAVSGGIAVLIALGIGQIIGNIADRPRPYTAMPDLHVLIHRSTDFSFPSDHATVAGAVAVALLLSDRRFGLIAAGAGVLMAAARVYVGVHYPSDVLAGLALGGLMALACWITVVPTIARMLAAVERGRFGRLVSPASIVATSTATARLDRDRGSERPM